MRWYIAVIWIMVRYKLRYMTTVREPEFIGGEVDLRINIYRGQVDGTVDLNTAVKVPDTADIVPDTMKKCRIV